jgi:hypothetical protein
VKVKVLKAKGPERVRAEKCFAAFLELHPRAVIQSQPRLFPFPENPTFRFPVDTSYIDPIDSSTPHSQPNHPPHTIYTMATAIAKRIADYTKSHPGLYKVMRPLADKYLDLAGYRKVGLV